MVVALPVPGQGDTRLRLYARCCAGRDQQWGRATAPKLTEWGGMPWKNGATNSEAFTGGGACSSQSKRVRIYS